MITIWISFSFNVFRIPNVWSSIYNLQAFIFAWIVSITLALIQNFDWKSSTKLLQNFKKSSLNGKTSKWFSKHSRHLKWKVSLFESLRSLFIFLWRSAFSNFSIRFLVQKSQSSCTVWYLNSQLKFSSTAESFRTCSKIKIYINWSSAFVNSRFQEVLTKFLPAVPIHAAVLIFNPFGIFLYDIFERHCLLLLVRSDLIGKPY